MAMDEGPRAPEGCASGHRAANIVGRIARADAAFQPDEAVCTAARGTACAEQAAEEFPAESAPELSWRRLVSSAGLRRFGCCLQVIAAA